MFLFNFDILPCAQIERDPDYFHLLGIPILSPVATPMDDAASSGLVSFPSAQVVPSDSSSSSQLYASSSSADPLADFRATALVVVVSLAIPSEQRSRGRATSANGSASGSQARFHLFDAFWADSELEAADGGGGDSGLVVSLHPEPLLNLALAVGNMPPSFYPSRRKSAAVIEQGNFSLSVCGEEHSPHNQFSCLYLS